MIIIEKLALGLIEPGDIKKLIVRWSDEGGYPSLRDFLGLSSEQFAQWATLSTSNREISNAFLVNLAEEKRAKMQQNDSGPKTVNLANIKSTR